MSVVFTILTMLGLGLTPFSPPPPDPNIKSLTKCVRIVKHIDI